MSIIQHCLIINILSGAKNAPAPVSSHNAPDEDFRPESLKRVEKIDMLRVLLIQDLNVGQ